MIRSNKKIVFNEIESINKSNLSFDKWLFIQFISEQRLYKDSHWENVFGDAGKRLFVEKSDNFFVVCKKNMKSLA